MRRVLRLARAKSRVVESGRLLLNPVIFYTRTRAHIRARALTLLILTVSLLSVGANLLAPSRSTAATNNTINFQARLQTSSGNIVNDGTYNVQFKLYDVSSGGSALWTETYQNSASQGVQVINGYLSVSLGSISAFPSTINWDQNLYLTMNIGGTSTGGSPTYDGEMNPRLSVTGIPYAFRAGQLAKLTGSNTSVLDWATQSAANTILLPNEGGTLCIQNSSNCGFLTSSNAIQNTTTTQTNASFNIQSSADANITGVLKARASQTADLFQAQNSTGAALLRINASGVLIGANGSGTDQAGSSLTVAGGQGTGTGNGGNIVFQIAKPAASTGSGLNSLSTVFSLSGANGAALFQNATNSTTAFQVQNATATSAFSIDTTSNTVKLDKLQGLNQTRIDVFSGFQSNGNYWNSFGSALTTNTVLTVGSNVVGNTALLVKGVASQTADILLVKDGSSNSLFSISASGAILFQNNANSAAAFQIQKSGSGPVLFGVDTSDSNGRIFTGVANGASAIGFKLDTPSYTTSGAKLLSVQNNASEKFSIDKDGNVNVASGAFYRINGVQLASTDLGDASNLVYLNGGPSSGSPQLFTGYNVFRVNATDAFQIQRTNASTTVFRADTANGRVAINLGSAAPTYTLDVGGDVNISSGSVFRINGTDINSAGTLNNVAYLNQANAFTAAQSINAGSATGKSLSVTTSGNPTSGNAVIFASNTNASPTGNLLDLRAGSTPSSKFSVAADGAFVSTGGWTLNSSGNAVATLNASANTNYGQILFQEGGSSRGSIQYYGSNQNASGVTNSSLALQNDNGPIIFRQNNTNTLSVSGSDGAAVFTGIQPASVSGNGTAPGAALTVNGAKGGNTSGTSGQTGGTGASIVLNAGNGGNAASGSNNGNGGNVTLSAGAAGIGGTGGSAGNVIVRNAANSTTAFQVQNASGVALLTADTTNNKVNVLGTLTVGVAGSTSGTITVANAANSNLSTLQFDAVTGGDATYTVPAIPGGTSDTVCLLTLSNCGASITVSGGQNNYVARFTGANSFGIGKLYDDTNFVGINTTTDNGQLSILSRAAAEPGLYVKAAASATSAVAVFKGGATPGVGANLLELQNNGSSTPLAYFDANGNLNAPFGTFTGGALLQSDLTVNTIATIKGANSLTLGETGTATGSILFKGSTAASGTIKLIAPNNPTAGTFNLSIPTLTANDTICTNGLLASACPNYAPATGSTNYLGKNTNDTSSASYNGTLLALSNTNSAGSSVLSLTGAGTNSTLIVNNSANPTSGQALIYANNSNASATGNLIDLRNNGTSKFSVNAAGDTSAAGTLGVAGDFAVATNKLTVQASTGNTAVAGTLDVTGSLTASGGLAVAANQGLTMSAGTGTFIQNYQNAASGGSLTGNFSAHTINATNFNNGGSNVTLSGVNVALTGTATSGGTNTNNAINLANVAAATNNNFNAVYVGTGYNSILNYGGTTLINGNGLVQNAALDSTLTYTNIQKVGALSAGSITTGFGTISTDQNITTTATVQGGTIQGSTGVFTGANAITLGTTGTNTGAVVFKGSTAASGTVTLQGPNNPSTNNYKLFIPQLTADATICTDQVNCTAYAPSTGGNYIAKNSNDSSSAGYAGYLLTLSNTSTGASAGGLSVSNAGTSNTLNVTSSNNPAAGNALLYVNNSNASATGNLMDLRNNGTSKFSVDATGALTLSGAITVNAGISTSSGDLSLNAAGSNVNFNNKNLTSVGTISSGAITSSSTVTGTTVNGTTGINTGATGGTQRIDSSGNLVNIGNFTASGASVFSTTGANGFAFKPGTDNSAAFVIQKADGLTNMFSVDTGAGTLAMSAPTTIDTGSNTGKSLSVTTSGNPTSGNAVIFASNTNASPSGNLLDLRAGSTPSSKFSVAADGTFISVGSWTQNAAANATQVLNFGAATNFGQITFQEAGSSRGSIQYTGSNAGVSGVANNSLVFNNDNGAVMFRQNGVNTFSVLNDGTASFNGIQPASVAGTGTSPAASFLVTGTKGGNTSGTTGQTAGTGAGVTLTAGAGGNAASGSTNGNGGTITLSGGAAGSGTGTAGTAGGVLVKNAGDSTTAFRIQNANASLTLLNADTTGSGTLSVTAGNFQALNANGWQELNLDTTNANMIANPSFEINANGWAAHGGSGAPARDTIEKYIGTAAGKTAATAINHGVEYSVSLTTGQTYALGAYVKFSATNSNQIAMGAATSTTDTNCSLNGGTTPTISTSGWTYIYCTFSATAGQDRIYIKQITTAVSRTIYIDGVQLLNANSNSPYKESTLSVNSVINSPAVFQNQSDSTTAFVIQNTTNTTLLGVDTLNGNVNLNAGFNVTGNTVLTGTLNTSGAVSFGSTLNVTSTVSAVRLSASDRVTVGTAITRNMTMNTAVNGNDVLVMSTAVAGRAETTTIERDPRVVGIAQAGQSSGLNTEVQYAGFGTVNADTGAINVGDQLVTSVTAGRVKADNAATTGIIGYATSSKAAGSNGSVTLLIRPFAGQSNPAFRTATDNSAAFQVQNASGATLLNVDNTSTNVAVDGGAENSSTFSTNWTAFGTSTVTRTTTSGEFVSGNAAAKAAMTGAATSGVKNNLGAALATSTTYVVSFSAKSSTSMTDLTVRYERQSGTQDALCANYNSQSIDNSAWKKITCTITTTSTAGNTTADLAIYQAAGATRNIFIDNLSIIAQNNTGVLNVSQLRVGGLNSQGLTLLTLDTFAGAPNDNTTINTALYGSMYFDTTAGALQCYGTAGWANCAPAPNVSVNLIPEYVGVVLNGSGIGTMTSNICSGTSKLSINTSVCAASEDYNYYQWTSPQATNQTYSLYVRYQLPATFKNFSDNSTIKLNARVTDTANAQVKYTMYLPDGSVCGTANTDVTTSAGNNTWSSSSVAASFGALGGNETSCTLSANDIVMFKIDVMAKNNANAYVSNLSFLTLGK